jgi:hypothetical protein
MPTLAERLNELINDLGDKLDDREKKVTEMEAVQVIAAEAFRNDQATAAAASRLREEALVRREEASRVEIQGRRANLMRSEEELKAKQEALALNKEKVDKQSLALAKSLEKLVLDSKQIDTQTVAINEKLKATEEKLKATEEKWLEVASTALRQERIAAELDRRAAALNVREKDAATAALKEVERTEAFRRGEALRADLGRDINTAMSLLNTLLRDPGGSEGLVAVKRMVNGLMKRLEGGYVERGKKVQLLTDGNKAVYTRTMSQLRSYLRQFGDTVRTYPGTSAVVVTVVLQLSLLTLFISASVLRMRAGGSGGNWQPGVGMPMILNVVAKEEEMEKVPEKRVQTLRY